MFNGNYLLINCVIYTFCLLRENSIGNYPAPRSYLVDKTCKWSLNAAKWPVGKGFASGVSIKAKGMCFKEF